MLDISWYNLRSELRGELTSDIERGNHFALIAPTGQGKTTLVTKGILPIFNGTADALIIDSTADPKLSNYGKPYQKYGKIKGVRRLTIGDMSNESREKIRKALARAYKQGDIVIVFDEVRHVCDKKYLGLQADAEFLWLFSRKRRCIVGGLTQAPRWVPSAFYDQSKLHFIFKIKDRRAMLRLAEIGGDFDALKQVLPTLARYEFAYVSPDGDVLTSKLDLNPPAKRLQASRGGLPPSARSRKLEETRGIAATGGKVIPDFLN